MSQKKQGQATVHAPAPETVHTSAPATPEIDYAAEIQMLSAQNEAIAAELAAVREELEAERDARKVLSGQLDALALQQKEGSSATIAPKTPEKPVRPEVTIGEDRYRFKVGEVRLGRNVVKATEIAADENRLSEVFSTFPGLFEKL